MGRHQREREQLPLDADVHLDAEKPTRSHARIVIQAASVDARNTDRGDHLRSNDFFAMEQYPTITFETTEVEAKAADTYAVTGDLTINDVTKPVTLDSPAPRRTRGAAPVSTRRQRGDQPQGLGRTSTPPSRPVAC